MSQPIYEKPELKRCPLCGRAAVYEMQRKPYLQGWIGCRHCLLYTNWTMNGFEDAVKRWNNRYYEKR